MQFRDYYRVLGVTRKATQDEIKRAYRKKARKYHPDVSREADAEVRFKEVGEAYEVLKDSDKRAAYDQFGHDWKAGQDFRPPPDWDAGFEFRGGVSGGGNTGFSEFFDSLFGGGSPFTAGAGGHSARPVPEDHHAKILITLEEAFRGGGRNVQLQMPEVDARGRVALKQHNLKVTIPRGVVAGQKIRLAGQGGNGGGPRGDLHLEIEFRPHPDFRADGRDIYASLAIAPWEAALGARVPVTTLGGKVELTVPAGAQSGQKFRLRGRGLPGSPPGDQYVELRMVTPPARDADSRAMYNRMAEIFDFDPRNEELA